MLPSQAKGVTVSEAKSNEFFILGDICSSLYELVWLTNEPLAGDSYKHSKV